MIRAALVAAAGVALALAAAAQAPAPPVGAERSPEVQVAETNADLSLARATDLRIDSFTFETCP